jgi:precorrin-6B methylase 2
MSTQPPLPKPSAQPSIKEIDAGYREFNGGEIPNWHFAMMNDPVRNGAYDAALGAALKKGGIVLDIGSGSGLLAMMAARQGATRVITCEEVPLLARKATEIIQRNGLADRIQVINKRSTDLIVGKDFPERADVLVTEIFDDGLLGEGAFPAIEHAREHLLKPHAQLIPTGVRVMAMCVESQEIFENHRVGEAAGFDLSAFNEFSDRIYIGYHLEKVSYRALTAPRHVFTFDFKQKSHDEEIPVEFEMIDSGRCHAVAYWFELRMDEKTIISSAPGLAKRSSWKQAVQIFEDPRWLERGSRLKLIAHHDSEAIWFSWSLA